MKTFVFAALFMLVISLSTSTAMACAGATPLEVNVGDEQSPVYVCLGDGEWSHYPVYVSSNGSHYAGNDNVCNSGTAYSSQYQICLNPPCPYMGGSWYAWYATYDWDRNMNGMGEYAAYQDATALNHCDPYDWSSLKLPKAPFQKKTDTLEARLLPYRTN